MATNTASSTASSSSHDTNLHVMVGWVPKVGMEGQDFVRQGQPSGWIDWSELMTMSETVSNVVAWMNYPAAPDWM